MKIPATIRKLFFLVLLAGIFVWLLCAIFHPFEPQEPEYRGKKLTDWAEEIDPGIFVGHPASLTNQKQSELAISAIRHIGTNALPVAVKLCGAKDSWLKQRLAQWVERYNANHWPKRFPVQIVPAWDKNYEGENIIWALGPVAEPAMSSLVQLLQSRDREIAESAMTALPGIGTNAIPPLEQLLNGTDQEVRVRAATILGEHFGSQAHAAVPVLFSCLGNRELDLVTRIRAIYSLGFIKEDAPVIVPTMIRHIQSEGNDLTFQNPDALILRDCFLVLGNLGTNAKAAVPFLTHILESNPDQPRSWDKEQALGNLMKIDHEIAKPFLEKWKASLTNGPDTSALNPIRTVNPPPEQLNNSSIQTNSTSP